MSLPGITGMHGLVGAVGSSAGTFDPVSLFAGTQGGLWDVSNTASLFQTVDTSTPVSANNDPIGRINDLSGNGNHVLFPDPTTSARPLYKTNSGLPYALFDGSNDYLRKAFTFGTTWERMSAIQIVAFSAANEQYFGGVTANECVYGNAANLLTQFNGSGNLSQMASAPSLSTDYVLTETWASGSNCALRLDNGGFSTPQAGAVNPGGITIGASSSGSDPSNMRLYAVLMINRALTSTERANLVTWMAAKQGRVL